MNRKKESWFFVALVKNSILWAGQINFTIKPGELTLMAKERESGNPRMSFLLDWEKDVFICSR